MCLTPCIFLLYSFIKDHKLKKTVLIFGISGFTGRHFSRFLNEYSKENDICVVGVVRHIQVDLIEGANRLEVADASNYLAVLDLIHKIKPDYIVNFIGLFGNRLYPELIQSNVDISKNILNAVVELLLVKTRLLFIGSAAEYGTTNVNPLSEDNPTMPVNLYGLSKVIQTDLVQYYHRVHQVQAVIARTFNLTGEGISTSLSLGNFRRQIDLAQDGDAIKVGNLDSERDFLEVTDAVALYLDLLFHGKCGEVYNVCSGVPVRLGDLLSKMLESSGKSLIVEVSPQLLRVNDLSRIYGCRLKLDELLMRIPRK
jgi:nucleoside-diphosphate-sugar epimerase